jgi:hypothetical protein
VPEIHRELDRRGVAVSERSVTNLLDRYDELVAASAGAAAHRAVLERQGRAYVNELRPTLLTNVGSPWLQWLLITDAARPSQPARPLGAVQKAARRPCRVANTLIMRQRLAWPGCV